MGKGILFPFRILHGKLHSWTMEKRKASDLGRSLSSGNGNKLLVPGTPLHTNLGDSAIVIAQIAFLKGCGIAEDRIKEVTFEEYIQYGSVVKRKMAKSALVTQLGGGNMGNQWLNEEYFHRRVTEDFPQTPMVIFPQTIYYTPDEDGGQEKAKSIPVYTGHDKLTMVAREKTSYDMMTQWYPKSDILLTPDIVLSAAMDTFGVSPQQRKGILLCMRGDAERSLSEEARARTETAVRSIGKPYRYMDMHAKQGVMKNNRFDLVRAKMEEFTGAELVITDRLHGMIFAAITGTPCIVFSNYNHKVRGTYEWIKYLPYIRFAESVAAVEKYLPELLEMKDCHYDKTPLEPYFEKLAEVVKKYACN